MGLASLLMAGGIFQPAIAPASPLSLLGDRFHVEATWRTADGHTGTGTPVSLTAETGYFWFFSPQNVEVVVKVLDACASSAPRFWVFGAGLTNAEVTLAVTDEATGQTKSYHNAQGQAFQPIQDTAAFATCGTPRCGQGSFAELQATPRADLNLEALALAMGGGLTAPQDIYERLVADVASIRRQRPELAGIAFPAKYDPQVLLVTFPLDVAATVADGTYHSWDCLNRWYGVESVEGPLEGITSVLHFDKVLDVPRLVADYAALPGVQTVEVEYNVSVFPVPRDRLSSLCAMAQGSRYHYFLRQEGVPTGPTYYFHSDSGGAPLYAGSTAGDASSWIALSYQCFALVSAY